MTLILCHEECRPPHRLHCYAILHSIVLVLMMECYYADRHTLPVGQYPQCCRLIIAELTRPVTIASLLTRSVCY